MIKCENNKVEMDGTGGDLIIEMAMIINAFKDLFEERSDDAYEAALAMSSKATYSMFAIKDVADA